MFATIKPVQSTIINLARNCASDKDRKAIKKDVFAQIKADFGIDPAIKVKVETIDGQPDYLVLKRSDNSAKFALGADGKWTGADQAPQRPNPTRWFFVGDDAIKEIALDTQSWDDGYDQPCAVFGQPGQWVQITQQEMEDATF